MRVCLLKGWEMKSQLGLACQLDLQVLCQLVQELKGIQVVGTCHTANGSEGHKTDACQSQNNLSEIIDCDSF